MNIRAALVIAFIAGWTPNSLAQDLVRVPGGTHEVTDQITTLKVQLAVSEFLLGAAEVTQREYQAITSSNPSVYKGADRTVKNVSWWEAIRYCNLRSAKESLTPCYDLASGERDPSCTGYRLPTETESIVAASPCRASRSSATYANLGISSTKSLDVFEQILERGNRPGSFGASPADPACSTCAATSGNGPAITFDPITSPDAVRDPSGPPSGLARVIRGGSFVSSTSSWSREFRSSMNPGWRSRFTRFPGGAERPGIETTAAPAAFRDVLPPLQRAAARLRILHRPTDRAGAGLEAERRRDPRQMGRPAQGAEAAGAASRPLASCARSRSVTSPGS